MPEDETKRETADGNGHTQQFASLVESLRNPRPGVVRVNGSRYRIATGRLPIAHDDAKPWTLLSGGEAEWLAAVDAKAQCRIGEVAKVRVGIKTTADSVFIRDDWQTLPGEIRPEPRHLRPLLSQDDAAQWRPLEGGGRQRRVRYTHELLLEFGWLVFFMVACRLALYCGYRRYSGYGG